MTAEREALKEVKSLGGVTLAVANTTGSPTRRAANLLVELNLDVPKNARKAASILKGQLLGLMFGLKKGLNPDRPRYLSHTVILNC